MRTIVIAALVALLLPSCRKDKTNTRYTGTVVASGGCYPDAWLVVINETDAPFLCNRSAAPAPAGGYNCRNAVIMRLPANLAAAGKKITFTRWTDDGILCQSYSYASRHLQASDLREQ